MPSLVRQAENIRALAQAWAAWARAAEPSKSAVARALDMGQERERERERALECQRRMFLEALALAGDDDDALGQQTRGSIISQSNGR